MPRERAMNDEILFDTGKDCRSSQRAVRSFLRAYNKRHRVTILLTSHYMADITALCDRVLLLHKGQLIYDGALDTLLNQFAPYREVTVEMADEHPAAPDQQVNQVQ